MEPLVHHTQDLFILHNVPNFVKDVPRVLKSVARWGLTMNHFLMGCQRKLWAPDDKMRVPEAIGWDVPNLVKDVPRVPKCVLR